MKTAFTKLRPGFLSRFAPSSDGDYFFVELEDAHRTWHPGDTVHGNVILVLYKPQRISAVDLSFAGNVVVKNPLVKGKGSRAVLFEHRLRLHGRSKDGTNSNDVVAVPVAPQPSDNASTTSSSRMSIHTVNTVNTVNTTHSHHSVASHHTVASHNSAASAASNTSQTSQTSSSSASSTEELEIGEHRFAFILEIPQKGLYNSLEFERGSISYVITATAKRHGPLTALYAKRVLQLVCPVDVSRLPPPKPSSLSVEIQKRKKQQGIITTTLEVGRGGYLRGESFPVKITIQHVKCVKCLRGLVVTLCRFSKVTCGDDEPQSFRKDLSQTVSPLYTDPVTFASTVSTTLRIPPDVFPTTKGHGLVSFNYCVEVVIDLAGKWDLEEDRTGFLHTDRLKRNKGVVSLWTEVIIGTDRRRYRSPSASTNRSIQFEDQMGGLSHTMSHSSGQSGNSHSNQSNHSAHSTHNNHHGSHHSAGHNHPSNSSSPSSLTEKQLMRLREEALLPSEPTHGGPSLDAIPSAPEYHPDGSYSDQPTAPPGPSSPGGASSSVRHYQPPPSSSDKHEHELRRLQGLTSNPYGHEESNEDHVPQYKEKEKEPEEMAAIQLSQLASVPPMEEGVSGDENLPSAPPGDTLEEEAPSAPPGGVILSVEQNGSILLAPTARLAPTTDASAPIAPGDPSSFPPRMVTPATPPSAPPVGLCVESSGTCPSTPSANSSSAPSPHGFTTPPTEPSSSAPPESHVESGIGYSSDTPTPQTQAHDTNESLSDSDDIYS